MIKAIVGTVRYIKARLKERTSWVAIVGAITAASYLTFPWDIVAAACGIIGVMVPEGEKGE